MYLGINSSTATVGGGSRGGVGLLLFKRSTNIVVDNVMVHLEKEIAVCDAVSIGEYQDGRNGEVRENFANDDFDGRRELNV